jgi:hypothetical protein
MTANGTDFPSGMSAFTESLVRITGPSPDSGNPGTAQARGVRWIGPVIEVEQMFLASDQALVSSLSRATRSCTSSTPLMRYSNSPRFSGSCLVTT